jgi:hypothetical protein
MAYHPHAHLLATAGALTYDQAAWIRPANPRFILPGFALAKIFHAKIRDALQQLGLLEQLDQNVFQQPWVVHVRKPEPAPGLAEFLSRYIYRTALTNQRIETFDNQRVTSHSLKSQAQH